MPMYVHWGFDMLNMLISWTTGYGVAEQIAELFHP